MFVPYERGPLGVTPGQGLGLSLVRTIAQRHGGTVRMASREGVGTRVWLALPVAGPPDGGPVA